MIVSVDTGLSLTNVVKVAPPSVDVTQTRAPALVVGALGVPANPDRSRSLSSTLSSDTCQHPIHGAQRSLGAGAGDVCAKAVVAVTSSATVIKCFMAMS
jgi:hypothetical protein